MMKQLLFLLLIIITIFPRAEERGRGEEVVQWMRQKPIRFTALRKRLTREYSITHYGKDTIQIEPRIIVIHWTAAATLHRSFRSFYKERIHDRKYLQKYGAVNVSAHFLVDRDGTVYALMPETLMARHVIGLNHCSIGIENVGSQRLTRAQLKANERIIRYLANKYPAITHLIGHYEYRKFETTPFFIEKIAGYRTIKSDPGTRFMGKLRALVSDLPLKGAPGKK